MHTNGHQKRQPKRDTAAVWRPIIEGAGQLIGRQQQGAINPPERKTRVRRRRPNRTKRTFPKPPNTRRPPQRARNKKMTRRTTVKSNRPAHRVAVGVETQIATLAVDWHGGHDARMPPAPINTWGAPTRWRATCTGRHHARRQVTLCSGGDSEPTWVTAGSLKRNGTDDTTIAMLGFPGNRRAQFCVSNSTASVSSYRIAGTEGSLRASNGRHRPGLSMRAQSESREPFTHRALDSPTCVAPRPRTCWNKGWLRREASRKQSPP